MAPLVAASLRCSAAAMRFQALTGASTSRLAMSSSKHRRGLATEAGHVEQDSRPEARATSIRPVMDSHTVEELHSMSAEEILKEGGTRKEASMRHFTVNFGYVLRLVAARRSG
jgi:NADH dehydrogenase (ubiquinone) Fe-S protein 2